ncbi:cell division protein FtsA [Patescibacteria group bacterium]|nr:cell division protein FtsA [Patescibacteria group bacterium]
MSDNIITGLDIGSSSVRLVVGQVGSNVDGKSIKIIGAVEASSSGINKGIVSSIEGATSSISTCLDKAERLVGVPINSAWVSINSPSIKCERSRGVVAVSKSDGEITYDDVDRVLEAARALSMPSNSQILHVIPVNFIVDNQEDIKDPVGMTGVRLEVEALVIRGITTEINNLTKAIYRTGLDIDDLVISPMAITSAVLSNKQKEIGAVVINIGATTTSLAIYEEDNLLHCAILKIGSEDITKDLAIGLRCPIEIAEKIKIEYGHALPQAFMKKDEVDISSLVDDDMQGQIKDINPISRRYVAEIVGARVEEIFEKVDRELKKVNRSGMLPAGAFLIGGGVKLPGIVEIAKEKLRLPVVIANNKTVEAVIEKVNDPQFLTALGLVLWGHSNQAVKKGMDFGVGGDAIKNFFSKVKNGIMSLKP